MSLLTITPSFNIILKRDGFSPYSITQAGCSFLFLLPAYHKGTSCHLQHDVPTYGQKIYYTDKPLLNHIKSTLIFLNSCLSHTSPPEPSSILHVIHIIRLAGKQHILPVNISHITALHCITLHNPYLFPFSLFLRATGRVAACRHLASLFHSCPSGNRTSVLL